jgi:hypothetical protein
VAGPTTIGVASRSAESKAAAGEKQRAGIDTKIRQVGGRENVVRFPS